MLEDSRQIWRKPPSSKAVQVIYGGAYAAGSITSAGGWTGVGGPLARAAPERFDCFERAACGFGYQLVRKEAPSSNNRFVCRSGHHTVYHLSRREAASTWSMAWQGRLEIHPLPVRSVG